jgi:hypothetical protein
MKATKFFNEPGLCEGCGEIKLLTINDPQTSNDMHCDVCGATGDDIEVRASAIGPVSLAYCPRCLKALAEPYNALVWTAADIGGTDIAPWFMETVKRTLPIVNKTMEDFNKDVEKEIQKDKALLTEYSKENLPGLDAQDDISDPIAYRRYVSDVIGWQWFVIGYDSNEKIYYGYVKGWDDELGDFTDDDLNDAEAYDDVNFEPIKLSEIDNKYPNTAKY